MSRITVTDRMAFYAPSALGKSRRLTPEGFLVCEGVAIARTGEQIYQKNELPQDPTDEDPVAFDESGRLVVQRPPEEVFHPIAMASIEGKPVTVMHPNEFVTPETWRTLAVGTAQNIRRGEGGEDNLLLADLVITAADAIDYVNREFPEISVGYNAKYVPEGLGKATQREIVVNHVALVERGRAGPRCSIKDSLPPEEPVMKFRDRLAQLLTAMGTKDAAAVQAHLDAEVDATPAPAAVVATNDAAVNALRTELQTLGNELKEFKAQRTKDEAAEAEEETKRKEKEAKDKIARDAAAEAEKEGEQMEATGDTILEAEGPGKCMNLGTVYTGDALPQIKSAAEVLAPGTTAPTADSLKGNSGKKLAAFLRGTLDKAPAEIVSPFLMGRKVTDLKGEALIGVWNGATQLARLRNNSRSTVGSAPTRDFGKPTDITTMAKANKDFWGKQTGGTSH